jgi:ribosomal-protein-alanine N-acetyltransferase
MHRGLVLAPDSLGAFLEHLARSRQPNCRSFLIERLDGDGLVGVVNASEIVRGNFRSCYLGYYAFAGQTGQGLMTEGLGLVIAALFREEKLHRVEANIQPGNEPSRALVQRLGFRLEGLSPRYLKIGGRWRDHERWALLADEHLVAR